MLKRKQEAAYSSDVKHTSLFAIESMDVREKPYKKWKTEMSFSIFFQVFFIIFFYAVPLFYL